MMDFIRELITSPSFWIKLAIAIFVMVLAADLVRRLRARDPMNFGPRTSKPAKAPAAPAPKPAPASKASAGSKGGESLLNIFLKTLAVAAGAAVIVVIGYFFLQWIDGLPDNTPHQSSVSSLSGARMGRPDERQKPAVCMEPQQTVTMNSQEVTWVSVPEHCKANVDPNPASGSYDLSCKDPAGNEHEWTDEACWFYKALGFKKKAALPDQAEAAGSGILTVHLNFTTIP